MTFHNRLHCISIVRGCVAFNSKLYCSHIFTTRKRSLGQGHIFTSMCQEFCSQGGGAWSGRGGVGLLLVGGGGCLVENPPGRLLLRAVRILLECILVRVSIKMDGLPSIADYTVLTLSLGVSRVHGLSARLSYSCASVTST